MNTKYTIRQHNCLLSYKKLPLLIFPLVKKERPAHALTQDVNEELVELEGEQRLGQAVEIV